MPTAPRPGFVPRPVDFDQARKITRHEVGHWVAANCCGFSAGDITVTLRGDGGHLASASIELESDLTSMELIKSYLRRRIIVLSAGAIAESMKQNGTFIDGYAAKELIHGGAQNDHKGIRELLRILRGMTYGVPKNEKKANGQLAVLNEELFKRTADLIELHADVVWNLSDAIAHKAKFTDQAFGMTESEIRSLPAISSWLTNLGPRYE